MCPGMGGKRKEGEGTRAGPQATDLTGMGRLPAWQGKRRGVSSLHPPFFPYTPDLASELSY